MSPCCVLRSNLTHYSLRDQTFDAWNVYFVRIFCIQFLFLVCIWTSEKRQLSVSNPLLVRRRNVSLSSTRSITPMWPSWSGLKGKWNWHHFLFSFLPIKRWIQQHCTWPEFSHIPLRGTPLLRTHFRPLSGGCACLSLDEGERFVWKLLTGSTEAEH